MAGREDEPTSGSDPSPAIAGSVPDEADVASTVVVVMDEDATLRSDSEADPSASGSLDLDPPGTPFGRYVIKQQLGVGSMGRVLLAHDDLLRRDVAIKVVRRDRASPAFLARIHREARAMAPLFHPNVVRIYGIEREGPRTGIVMEYIAGEPMSEWRSSDSRTPAEVLDVFAQCVQGLGAAHVIGVVHRDFKPANVLVGEDGRARVADFGLATSSAPVTTMTTEAGDPAGDPEASLTTAGMVMGTPAYMPPEQHRGDTVDGRADQYSLALALVESLTGTRPFTGATVMDLYFAKERRRPDVKLGLGRSFRSLERALERALAPRPEDRFASIEELLPVLSPPKRGPAWWQPLRRVWSTLAGSPASRSS